MTTYENRRIDYPQPARTDNAQAGVDYTAHGTCPALVVHCLRRACHPLTHALLVPGLLACHHVREVSDGLRAILNEGRRLKDFAHSGDGTGEGMQIEWL